MFISIIHDDQVPRSLLVVVVVVMLVMVEEEVVVVVVMMWYHPYLEAVIFYSTSLASKHPIYNKHHMVIT